MSVPRTFLGFGKAWWLCAAAQTLFWLVAIDTVRFAHWWQYLMVLAWNICAYSCGQIAERQRMDKERAQNEVPKEPKMRG